MHLTDEQIALIVFFVAGWWISGALALVNPIMICILRVSPRFKMLNLGGWASYFVLGVILLLGLSNKIQLNRTPGIIWQTYAMTIPFVTVSHFAFLFWTRRKLRALNPETKTQE